MVTWDVSNVSTCKPSLFSVNSSSCYIFPTYFIACSLGVNTVLGLPANCYILWLSVKEMIRGQSTEIFVVNAALVEVIYCISYVFVVRQFFFNCAECKTGVYFFGMVMLVGRPLFQSCICVERYLGVLHPLIFLKLKPMKYRIACSAVGWVLIISLSLIVTVGVVELPYLVLSQILISFTIKLYSCLMVLKALVRPGPGDDDKPVNQDKIKAFRIIQMVLVSSVLMYGPMIVSLILFHIVDLKTYLLSWSVALCLGIMSGFVQPFLYLKRVGKQPFC